MQHVSNLPEAHKLKSFICEQEKKQIIAIAHLYEMLCTNSTQTPALQKQRIEQDFHDSTLYPKNWNQSQSPTAEPATRKHKSKPTAQRCPQSAEQSSKLWSTEG